MSFREIFFGKKVKLPGVEGSAPIKPIPSSEEGQKAMAAEKEIHPYSERADWDEKIDTAKRTLEEAEDPFVEEDESEEDIDVSDLK